MAKGKGKCSCRPSKCSCGLGKRCACGYLARTHLIYCPYRRTIIEAEVKSVVDTNLCYPVNVSECVNITMHSCWHPCDNGEVRRAIWRLIDRGVLELGSDLTLGFTGE